jgi:hypothetical protein
MPKAPLTAAELHVLGLIAERLDEADASLVRDAVSEIERLRIEVEMLRDSGRSDICSYCGLNRVRAEQATDF